MRKRLIPSAVGLLLCGSAFADATVTESLRSLVEARDPGKAYALGLAHDELMGDPTFDFYFGLAAIDGGRAGLGVLALERYLLQFPANRSARFQLARGYFVLGEDSRAKDEFDTLLVDATEEELKVIPGYLAQIRERSGRYLPTWSMFSEVGLGYDTNLNSGLSAGATPVIDGLGVLPPLADNAASVKAKDWFALYAVGGQWSAPIAPDVFVFGSAMADTKTYQAGLHDVYDQATLMAQAGISWSVGQLGYKVSGVLGDLRVDGQRFLSIAGVSGEVGYAYDPKTRITGELRVTDLSFDTVKTFPLADKSVAPVASDNSVRDSVSTQVALGVARQLEYAMQPLLQVKVTVGDDRNTQGRDDLSKRTMAYRLAVSATPAQGWLATVGLTHQDSVYQASFMPGSADRKDKLLAVDASVAYGIAQNWVLMAEYSHQAQSSNIGLYEFNRDVLSLKARYTFN